MKRCNTPQFSLTLGVNAGYAHGNLVDNPVALACQAWQAEAEKKFAETGVYVGAVVTHFKTVYRPEWGCPPGGEDTVVISGLRNPAFDPDEVFLGECDAQRSLAERDNLWRDVVAAMSVAVAKRLGQATGYLTFQTVLFHYVVTKDS